MSEHQVPDGPGAEPVCAFCGGLEDVRPQERLGVVVSVCAGCTARFSAARAPRAVRAPASASAGLPPTLGQQSSEVLRHVARMAQRAAARPYAEQECARCGATVHAYRAPGGGRRVDLAKDAVLAGSIPVPDRWRVRDGHAEPAGDDPDQVGARVLHELVCGAAPEPANARLRQAWRANRAPAPDGTSAP
ncbi:DUF6083 domain-containing protein [Kineococcus indalonis]|uniref:DUF6083 domain-containing protein n=1 Tax=Kineococcus indalonis TaxID=2696566 RepID=UPI001412283E|nr:DUF6083 domain-containing protein [Kineococcus indalonis]NAZ85085.1 hypothetical protein [Kineococcus indalonis]